MFSQIITQPDSANPNCRDYSAQANIEGRPQVVLGPANNPVEVEIAEGSPRQPTQYVITYAPPPYAYYPPYDP